MLTTDGFQVEFAVQMKNDECRLKIIEKLRALPHVRVDEISVADQRLVLTINEQSSSTFDIQNLLENELKLNSIIRGCSNFQSAVSELYGPPTTKSSNVFGVARFLQNEHNECLVDAIVDGIKDDDSSMKYKIGIHEYGDLSADNFRSIGSETINLASDLRSIDGKISLKKRISNINIMDHIGKSLAVTTTDENVIAAGVIARASKILNNVKKICDCSGKTLWQERESKKL